MNLDTCKKCYHLVESDRNEMQCDLYGEPCDTINDFRCRFLDIRNSCADCRNMPRCIDELGGICCHFAPKEDEQPEDRYIALKRVYERVFEINPTWGTNVAEYIGYKQPLICISDLTTSVWSQRGCVGNMKDIFDLAIARASEGKGKDRHDDGKPFHKQPICAIMRRVGIGFGLGQAIKKITESERMTGERKVNELLDAMNYLAAAEIVEAEARSEYYYD